MKYVQIISLVLAFSLTVAPSAQFLLEYLFKLLSIPAGYKTIFVELILTVNLLILLFIGNNTGVIQKFWDISKYWIPWLLYLVFQSWNSDIGQWKLQMYLSRMVFPVFIILFLYLVDPDRFEKYFFNTLIAISLVLIVATYLIDFSDRDFYRNIWLSRLIGICALYLFVSRKPSEVLKAGLLVFFIFIMFVIGSRGPLLSFILTAFILYAIKNKNNLLKSTFTGVMLLSVFFAVTQIYDVSDEAASFLSHGKTTNIGKVKNDRVGVYIPTLEIINENMLFGVGLGRWWDVYTKKIHVYKHIDYTYPHNIFLEIASELGVIGLILFSVLFIPYRRLFNIDNRYNIFILLGFLYAATSSDLAQNPAPMIFLLLSFASYKNIRERDPK